MVGPPLKMTQLRLCLRVYVGTKGRKVFGLKRMPGNAEAWKRLGHAWTEMKELSLETIIQF